MRDGSVPDIYVSEIKFFTCIVNSDIMSEKSFAALFAANSFHLFTRRYRNMDFCKGFFIL